MSPYQPDVEIDHCCDFGIPKRLAGHPGEAWVFWIPNGYSDAMISHASAAAARLREDHPDVPVFLLPEGMGLTLEPVEELRNLARRVLGELGD